jgi:hypothetical protein
LKDEKKLAADMLQQAAFYSGYTGETPKSLRHLTVVGTWEVSRSDGVTDLRRGDRLSFTTNGSCSPPPQGAGREDREDYEINQKQIHFPRGGLVFDYRANGDTLKLKHATSEAAVYLRRVAADPGS